MQWNSSLYDQEHQFVFHYGENVLEFLQAKAGERILDLGCGTGYLTDKLQKDDTEVTGIDPSPAMITKARQTYPGTRFMIGSAETLPFTAEFDAIFSNAALHWIKDQQPALMSVFRALKPGGRFVAEMGAKGNIRKLRKTMSVILKEFGFTEQAESEPWFFPSAGEYATLLENAGFIVNLVTCFDRPTHLQHQAEGIKNWIKQFGQSWLENINEAGRAMILDEAARRLEPVYLKDGEWYADYKRLRFIARKPGPND
jgi:trans-aconitate methyltransferase